MGIDDDHDDGLGGRSRDRREVTEANRWAGPLCALDPVELAMAPIPEEVRAAVLLMPNLRFDKAQNRHLQLIDKLVRNLEEDEIAAIDAFLAAPGVAYLQADLWCDRLIRDGDPALEAWLALHEDADRQRLRTLARNARDGSSERRRALRDALFGIG